MRKNNRNLKVIPFEKDLAEKIIASGLAKRRSIYQWEKRGEIPAKFFPYTIEARCEAATDRIYQMLDSEYLSGNGVCRAAGVSLGKRLSNKKEGISFSASDRDAIIREIRNIAHDLESAARGDEEKIMSFLAKERESHRVTFGAIFSPNIHQSVIRLTNGGQVKARRLKEIRSCLQDGSEKIASLLK